MKKNNLFVLIGVVIISIVAVLLVAFVSKKPQVVTSQNISLKNGDSYNLTASYVSQVISGKTQKMLAYNGSIPGPTINVEQGSEITINFKNDTDMPQLLHSHGVRMDNGFDGSQAVQKEIKSGESFAYKLKFPDAGVYWYHPHVNEVYAQGRGLYGAFIVEPKLTDYFPPVNQEIPLFLSDLPLENNKISLDKNDTTHALMGHYGNVLLINGQENYILNTNQGDVIRMYVINAANARPYNFAINGAQMKLIGSDSGAYERATFVDHVVLGPSERAIIDVYFANPGTYDIQNKTPNSTSVMGEVVVGTSVASPSYKNQFETLASNQETISSIAPFRKYFDAKPDKNLKLTIDMGAGMMGGMNHSMMHDASSSAGDTVNLMGMQMTREQAVAHCKAMPNMPGCEPFLGASTETKQDPTLKGIEWEDTMGMMNNMMTTENTRWKIVDTDTGKENMDIMWNLKKDQPVKIRIFNDPNSPHPMQHPIHFHGQRFLVVARDGIQQANLVWKDTVLIKSGETVDIILDPSNPGNWMAHCHIAEHLADGMMFGFKVN